MTDKYEKVEGMTVGQVVDAMLDGVRHYVKYHGETHAELFPEDCDCLTIKTYLDQGGVYRKIEAPWWENHIGSIVMVRDNDFYEWQLVIFKEHFPHRKDPFLANDLFWQHMRPLTQAEKDAIITEG